MRAREGSAVSPPAEHRSAGDAGASGSTLRRPAGVGKALLAALAAADGRRRMRKRDQTADACGLAIKRELLEALVRDDPEAEAFEAWLTRYAQAQTQASLGAVWAMARAVLEEWRLAHAMPQFAAWLESGAPSEDVVRADALAPPRDD